VGLLLRDSPRSKRVGPGGCGAGNLSCSAPPLQACLVGPLPSLPAPAPGRVQRHANLQARSPQSWTRLAPSAAGQPATSAWENPWRLLCAGGPCNSARAARALVVNRPLQARNWASKATLLFNLDPQPQPLLLSTPSRELVWALTWGSALAPAWACLVDPAWLFTLLLALRLSALGAGRSRTCLRLRWPPGRETWPQPGRRGRLGNRSGVGERLLANLCCGPQQGAKPWMARGGQWFANPATWRLVVRRPPNSSWIAANRPDRLARTALAVRCAVIGKR